jgi:polysaccharide export outer membrane protein
VYLQKDDVNVRNLPKDTVVRERPLADFDYKIQPNDLISVQFESLTPDEYNFFTGAATRRQSSFNLNQGGALLFGELVDENGEITYPVIGKVKVAGLTVFEAQEALQQLANQYLEAPIVKVRLLNFRVTLLGEVQAEGTITLTNNRVNIMEAIGQAGGLTDLADKSNIKLIRQRGGKTEIVYINLLEEDFLSSPYYFVNQNDILIVPALRQRPYRRYFGQNLSLIISSLSLLLLVINISRNN